MQCPTVSWRCFEHNSGTASIDVNSATFCVFSFFMCFDIWSNTMFGTLITFSLIRGFCLSATTESGQSRWQPLLCSKLDAAGVQAVSALRIDEKFRKMEQCFKTYCQGLARWWGSVVHVFVDF